MSAGRPQRILAVWCPDWPLVAAGIAPDKPGAILHANRVIASSQAARSVNVVRGLRRRQAQSRCPDLEISERDLAGEVRCFEAVAGVIEQFTPRFDIIEPGTAIFPVRGPSRYFGGDESLGHKMVRAIDEVLDGATSCHIGVADGIFTATLAARMKNVAVDQARGGSVTLVAPGEAPDFLAPFPVTALDHPQLTTVLERLGIGTLGDFAALNPQDVMGRFAAVGLAAHRRASGLDDRPANVTDPPPEMRVSIALEPAIEHIGQAAFAARQLAVELDEKLARRGAACSRISIEAESENGERYARQWRHDGALSVAAMTDRVRWQLDGWLNAPPTVRPTGGLSLLTLQPEDLVPAGGRQLGFWGGETEADQRAGRAVARLESLVGSNNVRVAQWKGGREVVDQMQLLPAGTVDLAERSLMMPDSCPWPGHLPAPSPVQLFDRAVIEVVDATGSLVTVSGRGEISAPPAHVRHPIESSIAMSSGSGGGWKEVVAWAGPWLLDERWWDPERARRRARFQLVDVDGTAILAFIEQGRWWLAGVY